MKWAMKGNKKSLPVEGVSYWWGIPMIVVIAFLIVFIGGSMATTSADRVNLRVATRQAPQTLHVDYATTRDSSPAMTIYCEVTAYSPTVAQTDGNPLRTASGKRVYVGGIAADLSVLPFGSIVTIEGYNGGKPCEVVDTGSAIRGNKLDVFMWSTDAAIHWGRRRNVRVEVLYMPKEGK